MGAVAGGSVIHTCASRCWPCNTHVKSLRRTWPVLQYITRAVDAGGSAIESSINAILQYTTRVVDSGGSAIHKRIKLLAVGCGWSAIHRSPW